jgi:hypothetical protein
MDFDQVKPPSPRKTKIFPLDVYFLGLGELDLEDPLKKNLSKLQSFQEVSIFMDTHLQPEFKISKLEIKNDIGYKRSLEATKIPDKPR